VPACGFEKVAEKSKGKSENQKVGNQFKIGVVRALSCMYLKQRSSLENAKQDTALIVCYAFVHYHYGHLKKFACCKNTSCFIIATCVVRK
jgi:hypothetical protein